MGWTFYHVDAPITAADRKAEIDRLYNWGDEKRRVRVLKSSMVGSTYYAAIEVENLETGEKSVSASVVLTAIDSKEWCNFGYKDMDESCGPCDSKCPAGILKLLTPTESEYANAWRERCWKYHAEKKSPNALKNLPYGAEIAFKWGNRDVRIVKRRPSYQFKTDWWQVCGENKYWSKKRIPSEYEVVSGKEAA